MEPIWSWLTLAAAILLLVSFYSLKVINKAPLPFLRFAAIFVIAVTLINSLISSIALLWGRTTSVAINTEIFWPANPPALDYESDGKAGYVSGGFSSAVIEVSGLSFATKMIFLLSTLATALILVMLSLFVMRIVKSIERGTTFTAALAARAGLVGWLTLISGLVASGALQTANYLSQVQLFGSHRTFDWGTTNGTLDNPWLSGQDFELGMVFGVLNPAFQLSIDIWPILIAFALLVSKRILKSGQEIRTELDGLV